MYGLSRHLAASFSPVTPPPMSFYHDVTTYANMYGNGLTRAPASGQARQGPPLQRRRLWKRVMERVKFYWRGYMVERGKTKRWKEVEGKVIGCEQTEEISEPSNASIRGLLVLVRDTYGWGNLKPG